MQRAGRKVQDALDAGCDDLIDDRLRMRRRYGDDGDVEPLAASDSLQLFDVVNGHSATRLVPNLVGRGIEERRNLETFLAKTGIVRQRQTEVTSADDGDSQAAVEPQDLP